MHHVASNCSLIQLNFKHRYREILWMSFLPAKNEDSINYELAGVLRHFSVYEDFSKCQGQQIPQSAVGLCQISKSILSSSCPT